MTRPVYNDTARFWLRVLAVVTIISIPFTGTAFLLAVLVVGGAFGFQSKWRHWSILGAIVGLAGWTYGNWQVDVINSRQVACFFNYVPETVERCIAEVGEPDDWYMLSLASFVLLAVLGLVVIVGLLRRPARRTADV